MATDVAQSVNRRSLSQAIKSSSAESPQQLAGDSLAATLNDQCGRQLSTDVQWVRWLEWGKEHWSQFCEATDPNGHFESNSSQGHKEYQDRLRAIAMREEGMGKGQIAAALGRSQQFVQTWWRKEAKEVPRPPGVHDYLKTEYWRDVQIVRGFGKGLGIYDEVVHGSEWQQQMAWGNDFRNGGRVVKYDKEGRMRPMGNQQAKGGYEAGHMPNLDKLTQKMLSKLEIQDRVLTRPGLLWYPDGSADAIPHRHECWTALMSFGSPRILTVDGNPVMLRDGDLIVFGTQRHGVPRMHPEGGTFDDYEGRVSAVFFFMPQGQHTEGANPWRPIIDQQEGPSRQMVAWTKDRDLSANSELSGLRTGPLGEHIAQLRDLGFTEEESAAALKATGSDVERAAEVLLSGGSSALLLADGLETGGASLDRRAQLTSLYKQLEALHAGACCGGICIHPASSSSDIGVEIASQDAALALRLQHEESSDFMCNDEQAILAQIEELEREEAGSVDTGALQAQFAQYEEMLDRADASHWDGRGDMMGYTSKREHMHIEQQDSATVYALGCGSLREKDFFELLSLHSIRVLYDLRADAESAASPHFSVRNLGVACKARGITFKHVSLGREGAYGILKHLKEDEGRNTLAELVWWAQQKHAAFLGAESDWRLDHRQAIATRLRESGHTVLHVLSDGSTEKHPDSWELPEFITNEEARLRKLEKKRLAGEPTPQKSAASRSTEAVAQKLTKPQQVVDVGAELRRATNQTELCRIQRRLADLQRKSEGTDAKAGLGPKLTNVNRWVKAEAEQQRENLAAGKTKDGREKKTDNNGAAPSYVWLGTGGTSGGNPLMKAAGGSCEPGGDSSASSAAPQELLSVECRSCKKMMAWEFLELRDGICEDCASQSVVEDQASAGPAETLYDQHLPHEDCEETSAVSLQEVPAPQQDASSAADCLNASSAAPAVKASWRAKRRHGRSGLQDS